MDGKKKPSGWDYKKQKKAKDKKVKKLIQPIANFFPKGLFLIILTFECIFSIVILNY